MNVLACCKWVEEATGLPGSLPGRRLGLDDRHALALAGKLAATSGGEVLCLSYAPMVPGWSPREALARGAERFAWIRSTEEEARNPFMAGACLAEGIRELGAIDLVVCADGSEDQTSCQVPSRIAALLDWPVVTRVCALQLEGDEVVAVRQLEEERETVAVYPPAVVAVLPDVGPAPIPSVLDIIRAKDKPVVELGLKAPLAKARILEERFLPMSDSNRKGLIFDGGDDDAVREFAQLLLAGRRV